MNTETPEIPSEQPKAAEIFDIIVAPDPRLRVEAQRVKDIGTDEQELIDKMIKTMKASDGIGLAATQVGSDKRIIVVDVEPLGAYDDQDASTTKHGKFEMINPVITARSKRAKWAEGCLSVPGFKDEVERDLVIDVSYINRQGEQKELKASSLLSACIQHEIDHLDGKLFIDRISRLKKDMVIAKLKKFRKHGTMVVRPMPGIVF